MVPYMYAGPASGRAMSPRMPSHHIPLKILSSMPRSSRQIRNSNPVQNSSSVIYGLIISRPAGEELSTRPRNNDAPATHTHIRGVRLRREYAHASQPSLYYARPG